MASYTAQRHGPLTRYHERTMSVVAPFLQHYAATDGIVIRTPKRYTPGANGPSAATSLAYLDAGQWLTGAVAPVDELPPTKKTLLLERLPPTVRGGSTPTAFTPARTS
ncbi:hypothetical protein MRX96_041172 [Rhipicephalus microplus]